MAARSVTQQVRISIPAREALERIRREESVSLNRDLTLAQVLAAAIAVANADRPKLRAALAKEGKR